MYKFIFLTLLVLCSFTVIKAQISADDIARIQSVGAVQITPNGEQVVYTLWEQADPKIENKRPKAHLFLWDVASKQSTVLYNESSVWGVKLRPNYQSVTFLNKKKEDTYTSLYEVSLKGGSVKKIFEHNSSISSYDWSPDGKKIVFIADEVLETKKTVLPYEPTIYEGNLKFKRAYTITPRLENLMPIQIEGYLTAAKWSPNGKYISLMSAPTPLVDDFYMAQTIKVADGATGKLIQSIQHKGKKGMISWSPNSKKIAFIGGNDIHDPIDGRIFVTNINDGLVKNIKPKFEGKFEQVYWAANDKLLFLASESAFSSIGTIKSNGENLKRIIKPGGPVVQHISIANDGSMALRGTSPTHPSELYLLAQNSNNIKRLTNFNSWLESRKLAKQELIKYKSRDGLEIHGVLVHPLNKKPNTRYPLIVSVHGGPEAHIANGWVTNYSLPGQMGATEGFYVFYPNYRGSTGRGLEFILTSQRDPAGKEFDDIVDGVDHLINLGWVDRNKVGVTGGSYGGYATAWLSTKYSDRFAAGVMFVGISNKISKWGTTDIPNEEYLVHARKWIWEDYDFSLKRSPIYYADKCKTPLLIMHGANDTRVHPSQSLEIYRHIKVRTKTPVKLVFYHGEGHGNRKATARYDYNLRLMRWFYKYLQGRNVDTDAPVY